MIGIYKITNLINGKIYIGKSTDIDRRWKEHIRDSKYPYKNRSSNFYRDINQLGVNNFNIEVLEECLESVLNDREIFYIAKYGSTNPSIGYNIENVQIILKDNNLHIENSWCFINNIWINSVNILYFYRILRRSKRNILFN
jgi:group I intron endonuclease